MRSLILASLLVLLASQAAFAAATLSTDKTLYKEGEKIIVQFTDPEGHSGAWIGLFEATAPTDPWADGDSYDLDYGYTSGATSGYVELNAVRPGWFQIRFFNADDDINIAAAISTTFEISTEGGRIGDPTLSFEQPIFRRGEHVKLHYTWNPALGNNAWVGLFKNLDPLDGTENPDNYDIVYDFIQEETSGVWVFDAPEEIGWYRAAIISGVENEWNPFCTVSMQVTLDGKRPLPIADKKNPVVLGASKLRVGDELTIAYAIDYGVRDSAWIGIMPASVTSLNEQDNDNADVDYRHVQPGETWYWTLYVPDSPGMYVVRLFPASDSNAYAVNNGVYFEVVPR
jgi:hypothetical protein